MEMIFYMNTQRTLHSRWHTAGALVTGMGLGLTAFATSQVAEPAAKSSAKAQDTPDPFITLNDASRIAYRLAKDAALARNGPVIFVEGDDLVLKKGAERSKVRFIPEIFHVMKAVSHVALAIDVTLAAHADENPLGDEVLKDLREYRGLLPPVVERLATSGLAGEHRERQKMILAECAAFLDSVIERRAGSPSDRVAFARRMWPLVTTNAASAARGALDSLHRQVSLWKGQLAPEEWSRLTVVVMGTQAPRKGNLAVQYFARLLGEPGEGRRIIYAEALFDEQRALELLATRIVDTQVGIDFFNDPLRMHRDLLSDAAQDYIPILIDKP
jgi:hypothetical protein